MACKECVRGLALVDEIKEQLSITEQDRQDMESAVEELGQELDDAAPSAEEAEAARSLLEKLLPNRPRPWRKLGLVEGIEMLAKGEGR